MISGWVTDWDLKKSYNYGWATHCYDPIGVSLTRKDYTVEGVPFEKMGENWVDLDFWCHYHINGEVWKLNTVAARILHNAYHNKTEREVNPFYFRLVKVDQNHG